MKKNNYIVFDMDGTIADLYSVPNWLDDILARDVRPYAIAQPMNTHLWDTAHKAQANGVKVAIVTWTAGGEQSNEYNRRTAQVKKEWLVKHGFPFDEFHAVKYGTTKANAIRRKVKDFAMLIDDNAKIRQGWTLGAAVDPSLTEI